MTTYLTGLACRECGAEFAAEARSACDECFGPLEPTYDYQRIRESGLKETIESGPTRCWTRVSRKPAWRLQAHASVPA